MLLCDEEKVAAIEFICGLAETFSSCELLTVDSTKVHQDCVLYSPKDGFYGWANLEMMGKSSLDGQTEFLIFGKDNFIFSRYIFFWLNFFVTNYDTAQC